MRLMNEGRKQYHMVKSTEEFSDLKLTHHNVRTWAENADKLVKDV